MTKMKMSKILLLAFFITLVPLTAQAKPGPVIITVMERLETHTDVRRTDTTIGEETFLYTLLSAYRQLDNNVFGSIYYLHKFSIDDTKTASNIGGVSVTHNWSNKWKMTYSYSYSSNPERSNSYLDSINNTSFNYSDSDRFSFSLNYKLNPVEKVRKRYSFKTTFGTSSDFSNGRTIAEKFTVTDDLTKRTDYTIGYQVIVGLTDDPGRGVYRSHYSNQYSLDFSYKLNKTSKLVLGYFFSDNKYHGADDPTGINDDSVFRLSYFKSYF